MRAALLEEGGKPLTIVDDIDIADPGLGEVIVRVSHCGLCHSDVGQVDGTYQPRVPIIVGHEAAGVVEAVGPGVTRVSPGDTVMLTPCPPCGHCYWCTSAASAASASTQGQHRRGRRSPSGGTRLSSRRNEVVYRGASG